MLKGITFEAKSNSVVSILGPDGTGKSTFFKCICNVLRLDSDEVVVDRVNILDLKGRELSKKIGYVPQTMPPSKISVFDSVLGRKPYIDFSVTKDDIRKVR